MFSFCVVVFILKKFQCNSLCLNRGREIEKEQRRNMLFCVRVDLRPVDCDIFAGVWLWSVQSRPKSSICNEGDVLPSVNVISIFWGVHRGKGNAGVQVWCLAPMFNVFIMRDSARKCYTNDIFPTCFISGCIMHEARRLTPAPAFAAFPAARGYDFHLSHPVSNFKTFLKSWLW